MFPLCILDGHTLPLMGLVGAHFSDIKVNAMRKTSCISDILIVLVMKHGSV